MRSILESAGVVFAESETRWLLETATGMSREQWLAHDSIDDAAESRALGLARRRARGEPLQYVTGVAGFRRLELAVGPGVLIPRPETELVAEQAMTRLPSAGTLVDVGTGSGAIALSVAHERPDATVVATEAYEAALQWAHKNQAALGLPVEVIHCDLLDGVPQHMTGRVDVVVSNAPYVPAGAVDALPADVVRHEPHTSLFAGADGLDVIRRIAGDAPKWLRRGGWLVLEIGYDQADDVTEVLRDRGYERVSVARDLTGRPRIVEGNRV